MYRSTMQMWYKEIMLNLGLEFQLIFMIMINLRLYVIFENSYWRKKKYIYISSFILIANSLSIMISEFETLDSYMHDII